MSALYSSLTYRPRCEDEILQCKEIFARLAVAADDSEARHAAEEASSMI
jgi:hypothetical protein